MLTRDSGGLRVDGRTRFQLSCSISSVESMRSHCDSWMFRRWIPRVETERLDERAEGEDLEMGIAFLSLVILCVFVYLFYALFRPENF